MSGGEGQLDIKTCLANPLTRTIHASEFASHLEKPPKHSLFYNKYYKLEWVEVLLCVFGDHPRDHPTQHGLRNEFNILLQMVKKLSNTTNVSRYENRKYLVREEKSTLPTCNSLAVIIIVSDMSLNS